MIEVVVVGAAGRLGSLVCIEAARDARFHVKAKVGRNESLASMLAGAAVVVDVATAGSTAVRAAACVAAGVPLVVATTGMSADDDRALADAARTIPVLVAANLSVSAHLAAALVEDASARWPGADVEVIEVHHNKKKDAPSGTALMFARAAAAGRNVDPAASIKRGRDGASLRVPGEIGVVAVRGGDVVGEHSVFFLGDGERIEIVHRVSDRVVFARGALAAAAFLVGKPAGRYSMGDVLA